MHSQPQIPANHSNAGSKPLRPVITSNSNFVGSGFPLLNLKTLISRLTGAGRGLWPSRFDAGLRQKGPKMTTGNFETTFTSYADVEELVRCFESGTLPRIRWTHHAHLMVGLWYISRFEKSAAIRMIRDGIKKQNAAVGTVDSPTSGFHETITLAWAGLVRDYLSRSEDTDRESIELYRGLVFAFSDRNFLFKYYSRDLLMSTEARAAWVEPDLMPLP